MAKVTLLEPVKPDSIRLNQCAYGYYRIAKGASVGRFHEGTEVVVIWCNSEQHCHRAAVILSEPGQVFTNSDLMLVPVGSAIRIDP